MGLSKEEKSAIRNILFRHLDGIAIIPSCLFLQEKNILSQFRSKRVQNLSLICKETNSNKAYINVALRLCCSQGWMTQSSINNEIKFTLTQKGEIALPYIGHYSIFKKLLPHLKDVDTMIEKKGELLFDSVEQICNYYNEIEKKGIEKDHPSYQIFHHICGLLIGPVLVHWGMGGVFKEDIEEIKLAKLGGQKIANIALFKLMNIMGWGELISEKVFSLNLKGKAFFKRCSAYGVTSSYLPMFNKLGELFYGNASCLWERPINSPEIHVDRTMNVWGSGGAHSAYFSKVDEIVLEIFNRPLEKQPAGIADMGCGNGALLAHLFELIEHKTLRGKHLDSHYLHLIGADLNKAALIASKNNLSKKNIEAQFLYADISNPDQYAADLKEKYNVKLSDLLNVRSFLDHNRIYHPPKENDKFPTSTSTGAFAFRGQYIPNNELEQNLIEHLKKWGPYINKFGLIVIELHTLPPLVTAKNIGKTAVTAYDGTHGYSDQYIVEKDVFLNCAEKAGIISNPSFGYYFPREDCATVSIHLLK